MLRDAGVAGEPLASAEAAMSDFYRSQGFREDAADHLRLAAQVRANACECMRGSAEPAHRTARGPEVDLRC